MNKKAETNENLNCRLAEITIKGFKNVQNGTVSFENKNPQYKASMLGLYGQNGSGKTALIDVIGLLSYLLKGNTIPSHFANQINVDTDAAEIKYVFDLYSSAEKYKAVYEVVIQKVLTAPDSNLADVISNSNMTISATVRSECLSYSYSSEAENEQLNKLIDTDCDGLFVPENKLKMLIGSNQDNYFDLMVSKRLAERSSRSFIFSRDLLNQITGGCKDSDNKLALRRYSLLMRLVNFGHKELFVINTSDSGMISLDILPLAFSYQDKNIEGTGVIPLKTNEPGVIPERLFPFITKIISSMNIVLDRIVPSLSISVKEFGNRRLANGETGILIELMSNKNGKVIPLCYESDGIKKIISILQLLIVVFNNPSVTVAIDEIDNGVFEYLLGELLEIISTRGKGQLIFTSHNLRPLETLDKSFIAFTTTNPENRYIRMANVKTNNNLRDFYYRDIRLGGQRENLYDYTPKAEIALVFKETRKHWEGSDI